MTMSATTRLENHRTALALLLQDLGDHAIDVKVFPPAAPVFSSVRRTTWESLERDGYVTSVASLGYRLTAKGWLLALEASGLSRDPTAHLLKRTGLTHPAFPEVRWLPADPTRE